MSNVSQRILKAFVTQGNSLKNSDLCELIPDVDVLYIRTVVSILTQQGMLRRTQVYGVKELTELGRTQADYVKPPPKTPEHILKQNRIRYARYLAKRKTAETSRHNVPTRLWY